MRRPFAFAALCAALVLSLLVGAPGRAQPGKKPGEKPARVVVYLPEDAALYVEGTLCPLKSERRAFNTAPLEPGKRYEYALRAEVTKNDTKVGVTLTAIVRAGETTEVRFGDEASFLAAGGLERAGAKPKAKGEPVRLPTSPAPWFVLAQLDEDGDLLWKLPDGTDRYLLRGGAFKAALASGTTLGERALSARLSKFAPIVVSESAKALAPEYLALLAPGALVVLPKGDFPDRTGVHRAVLFGAAASNGYFARVRWSAGPATGESKVARETAVEVPLRDLTGYGATGALSQAELAAALATERPVLLAERSYRPDKALLETLDKKALLLSLPVPFRDP